MQKNYCDRCGKELKGHEGKFIKFAKSYNVLWFAWDCISHSDKICYDNEELCKNCWEKFINIYDKFMKNKD